MTRATIDIAKLKRTQGTVRLEDWALITGSSTYTDDLRFESSVYGVVVRASHAAARIVAVDISEAAQHDQAIGVIVGADLIADGITGLPFASTVNGPDGSPPRCEMLPILALNEVRYVGQPVAFVVAKSRNAADEMAELVLVSYESGDCVTAVDEAIVHGAPQVDPSVANNIATVYEVGDFERCKQILAKSFETLRLVVKNNRLIANAIEPRASIGQYDEACDRWTLFCGNQGPHHSRRMLAASLGCTEEKLRLRVQRIGGGFGGKLTPYPEDVLVLYAAKKFNLTVHWRADRSESFLADYHARDHISTVTVGFDESYRITVALIEDLANLGAYPSAFGIPITSTTGNRVVNGVYHIPDLALSVKTVLTHTIPTAPYRGAGRPEAIHRLEVVLDAAAKAFNLDAAEIRRRNLISPQKIPYLAHSGLTYDSGNFPRVLERALALADWQGFSLRKQDSAARGLLRGRGLACHIDSTSGLQPTESVIARLDDTGRCHFYSGTQEMGQGISHTYAGLAASILELPIELVSIHQGDTDLVATGIGSYGSRSLMIGGAAVIAAANNLRKKLIELGANALETEIENVHYENGMVVAGDDSANDWRQKNPNKTTIGKANATKKSGDSVVRISDLAGTHIDHEITTQGSAEAPFCFPNGCYVCEVEVDPETGAVHIAKLTGVDDVGHVINETIVHGQTHGGLAQGIGQALFEHIVYAEDGQLLSGSTLDYALPRATDLPSFNVNFDQSQPATSNLLGVKGAGESGAVGGPPAVLSALGDAIPHCDFTQLQMPLTSEKIWRLLNTGVRPSQPKLNSD